MSCDGIILQFGTSRFLQAHADLFFHEAAETGQAVAPVVIVQTSGSAERAGRLAAFANPAGYPVMIRGLDDGHKIERTIQVRSVKQGLSTAADWHQIVDLFAWQAVFVVSNTGDSGYECETDEAVDLSQIGAPARSFPGKLSQLLKARFTAGAVPLTILPCELINRNGPTLRSLVKAIAERQSASPDFLAWIEEKVIFANTLVDRIVSEPLQPVGAVAEPYALWAIEHVAGLTLPCSHPSMKIVKDIEPYERLKLHILNLGHTVLAEIWLTDARPESELVRGLLSDPYVLERLLGIYRDEVIVGFAAHGLDQEAKAYVETTLERFNNPFLDHRIADIANNHALKVERRIGAFLNWSKTTAPRLAAIVANHPRTSP